MSDNSKKTVIEDGTEFDGAIKSNCGITLSGKVKGELTAPALDVTETGSVDGMVMVDELVSHGKVSGEIEAESVELSGSVSDNTVINATNLEVKLNQPEGGLRVSFGNCQLKVGEGRKRKVSESHEEAAAVLKADSSDADRKPSPEFDPTTI
jgi:cytoskeletal protein CcmA (bactofilin family)